MIFVVSVVFKTGPNIFLLETHLNYLLSYFVVSRQGRNTYQPWKLCNFVVVSKQPIANNVAKESALYKFVAKNFPLNKILFSHFRVSWFSGI